MHGNQHKSPKRELLYLLKLAREFLAAGDWRRARWYLFTFRDHYALAPASTRRRWKCGR